LPSLPNGIVRPERGSGTALVLPLDAYARRPLAYFPQPTCERQSAQRVAPASKNDSPLNHDLANLIEIWAGRTSVLVEPSARFGSDLERARIDLHSSAVSLDALVTLGPGRRRTRETKLPRPFSSGRLGDAAHRVAAANEARALSACSFYVN